MGYREELHIEKTALVTAEVAALNELDGKKAEDADVVHKTGDETKTGILIQEDESVLKNTFTQQIRNAASFYSSSLGKTIVINTPPLNGLVVFIDMEISILDNTTRDLIDVRIEGYWSGSGFVNSRGIAYYSTSRAEINLDFSLGRDANNAPSFIIERITGAFDYTVVNIKNITTSYTNGQNPNLRSGWSIKKETDLSGYTRFSIPKSKAANTDWVNSQGFLKQVNWGDIEGTLSNQTDLKAALESKGVQLTADQPNAMVYLKDSNGNVISSLNVGFLNNEGTTIFFNSATDEIELKDDEGNVLSSFPASALMTGVGYGLNLTGSTLELLDSANNVIDSVTLTIANVQGLQTELDKKALKTLMLNNGPGIKAIGDLSQDRTIEVDFSEVATAAQGAKADSAFGWGDHSGLYLEKDTSNNGTDLDIAPISFRYYNKSSANKPSWASTDGAVLTMSGSTSNRQLWIGRLGQIGLRGGTGVTPYTDSWIQLATQNWVNSQNFAQISQLFSDWKLWTNGSQKTSIGSGGKVDFQAGANIHIGYAAGGVVTISVQGLQMSDIAGLVSELQKYAADIDSLQLLAHSHANKAILDGISQQDITNWNNNTAAGKVDKSGDTMTGVLNMENIIRFKNGGHPLTETYGVPSYLAFDLRRPDNSVVASIYYLSSGSGANEFAYKIIIAGSDSNLQSTPFLEATKDLTRIYGHARIDNMDNANKDFVRWDSADKKLKYRTIQQTKSDLGLTAQVGSVTEDQISPAPGQKVFSTFKGAELTVVLPTVEEAVSAGGELEISIYNGTTLLFREYNDEEELVEVTVQDIALGEGVTSHQGSVRLTMQNGTWYKLG